jgi:hypothetical protein
MDTARRNRPSYQFNASTGLISREQHAGGASSIEIQSERERSVLVLPPLISTSQD